MPSCRSSGWRANPRAFFIWPTSPWKQPGRVRTTLLSDPISNIGDAYGIEATWGAGATVLQDYWRYHDLNIWNARYLIKPAATNDPGAVYHDPQWKIYQDAGASPRAWVVHKVIADSAPDKQELAIRTADLRTVASSAARWFQALPTAIRRS